MNVVDSKLANALLGKSILETLFVGAVAVWFFFIAFPPTFRGRSEIAATTLAGWATNRSAPYERVQVQLFIDGVLTGTTVANQSRPDVYEAGWAEDDWHGYTFPLTGLATGHHVARSYALYSVDNSRQALQLLGEPIEFLIDDSGRITQLKPPLEQRTPAARHRR
jgi:hypothetical protein